MQSNYRDRLYSNYGHNFQDAGEIFDVQAAQRWGRAQSYRLRNWLPDSKDAEIIDLACGGGKLLHFFKENGCKNIHGVDISPDQVALSRHVVDNVVESNILEHLDKNPNSYDLITAYDIIEHFHKDEVLQFLDGCYAALKPNGRLILQTPNADSPWGTMHRYNDFTHEVSFNPNVLSRLLKIVGFQQVEARESGPIPWGYSLVSTVRYVIWQLIRFSFMLWNLVETGAKGEGVFTRVFLITGIKCK